MGKYLCFGGQATRWLLAAQFDGLDCPALRQTLRPDVDARALFRVARQRCMAFLAHKTYGACSARAITAECCTTGSMHLPIKLSIETGILYAVGTGRAHRSSFIQLTSSQQRCPLPGALYLGRPHCISQRHPVAGTSASRGHRGVQNPTAQSPPWYTEHSRSGHRPDTQIVVHNGHALHIWASSLKVRSFSLCCCAIAGENSESYSTVPSTVWFARAVCDTF